MGFNFEKVELVHVPGGEKWWAQLFLHQILLACVEPGGLIFGLGKTKSTQ